MNEERGMERRVFILVIVCLLTGWGVDRWLVPQPVPCVEAR